MGKILITVGLILVIVGLMVHFAGRIPFFGKLPGDLSIERPNFRFYFPVVSSIVLSIIISLILFLISKYKN